jgi:hypothetical protein
MVSHRWGHFESRLDQLCADVAAFSFLWRNLATWKIKGSELEKHIILDAVRKCFSDPYIFPGDSALG